MNALLLFRINTLSVVGVDNFNNKSSWDGYTSIHSQCKLLPVITTITISTRR